MRRRPLLLHNAPGLASVEFALVLPLFLTMVMIVLALAIGYFSLCLAAAGVPAGARQSGVTGSASAGLGMTRQILSVVGPAGAVSGATQISLGAPGCERAVIAQLNSSSALDVPLLDALAIRFRAGSVTRSWQFWAGKPSDGCQ
jgi:hypothetical protein